MKKQLVNGRFVAVLVTGQLETSLAMVGRLMTPSAAVGRTTIGQIMEATRC